MINGYTRTCGLIGNPVGHTQSPVIHGFLAEKTKENLVYVPFHVAAGHLEEAVKGAYALNLLGCNVTVPYKTEVLPYLAELDPLAQAVGAVNTLVRVEGGFKGYNTDLPGLLRAMEQDGVEIKGEEILILGAGGAARAVALLFARQGAKHIFLLNRTRAKACAVAREVNALTGREAVHPMELGEYRQLPGGKRFLAVQATDVGMYPDVGKAVVEEGDFYEKIHTGYDLVFNPPRTRFMKLVQRHGGRAYNGMKMLLYQGIIAYELWTGRTVGEELAKEAYGKLLKAISASEEEKKSLLPRRRGRTRKCRKNIVLIGFMGSGKTTVGVQLSYGLRRTMEDMDRMIERREGRSIREIFEREGENYFRDLETNLLRELLQWRSRLILSVGGGTPARARNRKLLRELGTVVYLRLRPETVYERLKTDTVRPLLQGEGSPEKALSGAEPCSERPPARLRKIRALMEQRVAFYEETADLVLDVDGLQADEVVTRIIEELKKGG
ncbi:MAG: shikimate dehydrogenase [Clostridium sp.]|jgi:shikimate dehydrogenase|nr:shikimate dehydrogenase [Clostridium sp.]